MTPRQARIALAAFVLMAAGVVYNALYMQDGAELRQVADATQPPRAGQAAKRTAQLKEAGKAPGSSANEATADTIRAIQRELNQRGYGPVAMDGVVRPVTRAAIMSYEHDNRLSLTGDATEGLLKRLVFGAPAAETQAGSGHVLSPHAQATVKQVQRLLAANGYRPGPADGRLGSETMGAIRAFEQDQGLPVKGRVSAEVLSRLEAGAARLKSAQVR